MSTNPLPAALDVRELLENLLGRDVEVLTGASMVDPIAPGGAMVGSYVDKGLNLKAIVALDLGAAARCGAAIALIPARTADDSVESEMLPPSLSENAGEVLNIMASLFNAEGAPHVKLDAYYVPGERLPADIAGWVMAYVQRIDLQINVAGYGLGKISALLV